MRLPLLSLVLATTVVAAEMPTPSEQFVNSVGVNVHLSYTNSIYYENFPLVLQALHNLHVSHVRDGVADYGTGSSFFYTNHQALSKIGVGCDFIVGFNIAKSTVAAWPSRVSDVEAFEAANEADVSGDSNWASDLKTELGWLYPAAEAAGLPLIGPSLANPSSYETLGDIAQLMTFNNLHNYFAGFYPETPGWGGADTQGHGYGSIAWNLDQANIDGPGVPVWTTETGYDVNMSDTGSVPPNVYASYVGRLLFAQWNAGIKRTFLYELADDPSTNASYGLMDNTGAVRPAFTALSSLLNLLQDPGVAFAPSAVDYTIAGNTTNIEHTLLEKHDGTLFLAMWIAQPLYDPNAQRALSVPAQTVTITLPANAVSASLYSYNSNWDLNATTLSIVNGQVTFSVNGTVSVLEVNPASPNTTQPAMWLPPDGAWFHLVSKNSGKCLDVTGGPSATGAGVYLDQWGCWGGSNQTFALNSVKGGYEITVESSGLQLEVAGDSAQNGARIMQWPYSGSNNQVWNFVQTSDGYFTLNPVSTGKCLDVAGQSTGNGAAVDQWTCWGGNNQKWTIVPTN